MKKQNVFSDLLVLDFSRYLPGGYATQPFADWGSKVIKVEDTGQGDFCRHDPPTRHGISYYSTALCRNKQSISLNLKDEEAKEYCIKLASKADIIVESFRPGVTKRLGIDYETIKKQNPKIIYASISAYGQKDPRSQKALHDFALIAETGFLDLADDNAFPLPLSDIATAMVTGQALLAALLERNKTNEGAYIDISMFDCFVWWQSLIDSRWLFNGKVHKRADLEYPSVGYNIYETSDGARLMFAMIEPKFWVPFTEEIGLPELKDDCRKRMWQAPESFSKLADYVKSKSLAEWKDWLSTRTEYSVTPILTKNEAIPRIVEEKSNLLSYVDFEDVGRVLQTNIPHCISSLPTTISEFKEASRLGQDTKSLLLKLGATEEAIEEMAQRGAIKLDTPVDWNFVDENPVAPQGE